MTPDAVLHRYLELVLAPRLDARALADLVLLDADLLLRWSRTLGIGLDRGALLQALTAMAPQDLRDLAQAQIWAAAPAGDTARLGFEEWQALLALACVAAELAVQVELEPEGARNRVLLTITGVSLPTDPLMAELVAFRGAPPEQLQEAHPLLRIHALIELLEHRGAAATAETAQQLFGLPPSQLTNLIAAGQRRAEALIQAAGVSAGTQDWRPLLWQQAQVMAFAPLLGAQADAAQLESVLATVAEALFGLRPRYFLLQPGTRQLQGAGADDLAAVRLTVTSSASLVAQVYQAGVSRAFVDSSALPIVDRQIFRRLGVDQLYAVPMFSGPDIIGVMVCPRQDDDPADRQALLILFAALAARYLHLHQTQDFAQLQQRGRLQAGQQKMLRTLVHEASNPLSVVQNQLHLLELKMAADAGAKEQLQLINQEIRRAATTIRGALALPGLLTTGSDEPEPEVRLATFDLNELLLGLAQLHQAAASAAKIEIKTQLAPGAVPIQSDADLLRQVLTNLLRNAVEAMAAGGQLVLRSLPGVYRGGVPGVAVAVADQGPGLSEAVLANLFVPKVSTKGGDHAGLGLHICGNLVGTLGGALDVTTSDQGATFTLFLPLQAG